MSSTAMCYSLNEHTLSLEDVLILYLFFESQNCGKCVYVFLSCFISHLKFESFSQALWKIMLLFYFLFISLSFWLFIWNTHVTNAEALTSSWPFIFYYIDWTSPGQLYWLLLQTFSSVLLVSLRKMLEHVHLFIRRNLFLNYILYYISHIY